MRAIFIALAISLVAFSMGCQAHGLPPVKMSLHQHSKATIKVNVQQRYRAQYVLAPNWKYVRATLKGPNGLLRTQVANASDSSEFAGAKASLVFDDVPTGSRLTLAVELVDDADRVLASEQKPEFSLEPGENIVTFSQLTPRLSTDHPVPSTKGGYVTSLNGIGLPGRLASPADTAVDAKGRVFVLDNGVVRLLIPDNQGRLAGMAIAGMDSRLGAGFRDGPGETALFQNPTNIVVGPNGTIYIADTDNHAIRTLTIDEHLKAVVGTLSGDGVAGLKDGPLEVARFSSPRGLAFAPSGQLIVADTGNNCIRQVEVDNVGSNQATTVAGRGTAGFLDGPVGVALLNAPRAVCVGQDGKIYFGEFANRRIRCISPGAMSTISTIAGTGVNADVDGPSASASFSSIKAMDWAADGSLLVLTTRLRKLVFHSDGQSAVVTVAGGGAISSADSNGSAANFNASTGLSVDADGNALVSVRQTILRVANNGQHFVSRLFGLYQPADVVPENGGTEQLFDFPANDFAFDKRGNLYYTTLDSNQVVRLPLSVPNAHPQVLAGDGVFGFADGPGGVARFQQPQGIAVGKDGSLYVADLLNHCVRKIELKDDGSTVVSTIAGNPNIVGSTDGPGVSSTFSKPCIIISDEDGSLYVSDIGTHTIRKISIDDAGAVVSTVAGIPTRVGHVDGPAQVATFNNPYGLALDGQGNLYVADTSNHCIRVVHLATKTVTTLVGGLAGTNDGTLADARFETPWEIAWDSARHVMYVIDGFRIRQITFRTSGDSSVSTLAGGDKGFSDGPGQLAKFGRLIGLAFSSEFGLVVADNDNRVIRRVLPF